MKGQTLGHSMHCTRLAQRHAHKEKLLHAPDLGFDEWITEKDVQHQPQYTWTTDT